MDEQTKVNGIAEAMETKILAFTNDLKDGSESGARVLESLTRALLNIYSILNITKVNKE